MVPKETLELVMGKQFKPGRENWCCQSKTEGLLRLRFIVSLRVQYELSISVSQQKLPLQQFDLQCLVIDDLGQVAQPL
jgi:hypothetical protein